MTPIESAARALGARNFPNMHDGWIDQHWPEFVDDVRAVLEAVREPSDKMVDAGCQVVASSGLTATRTQWRAMIDAALAEKCRRPPSLQGMISISSGSGKSVVGPCGG